jgi:outer membrane scaffolding protein for murein synthesis (MipA/OmpV family)
MGAALLMLASTNVAAEEDMPTIQSAGLHGSIGIGVGTRPEYEGAKDSKTRLMPTINLFYGDTFFLTGMTAGANLIRYQTEHGVAIEAGPLLALRHGRDQDDNVALNGLGDIDRALDAGGFVRFRKEGWQATVDVRQNLTNTDQGAIVNFTAGYGMPLTPKLRLRTSLDTAWASSDYMKTFFGINAVQSAQSGIAQYEAGSGFKHVGINVMADYSISREWAGFASLRYKRLMGDAVDSPIVANLGTKDQVTASVGIKYRF